MSTLEKRRVRVTSLFSTASCREQGYMERKVLFDTQFTEISSTEKTEAQGKICANELESDNTPDASVWIAKY